MDFPTWSREWLNHPIFIKIGDFNRFDASNPHDNHPEAAGGAAAGEAAAAAEAAATAEAVAAADAVAVAEGNPPEMDFTWFYLRFPQVSYTNIIQYANQ